MPLRRTKVAVTGGAGFVGSQLGLSLARAGHHVVLIDNLSFGHIDNLISNGRPFGEFVAKDIRSEDLHRHFTDADCIFHFAGIAALPVCQSQPMLAIDVNVSGTGQVLEAARRANVRRIVFSSTSAVYENNMPALFEESDEVAPDLVYAASKKMAEDLCAAYAKNYAMDVVICRFFNVYGQHQDIERTNPPFTSYVARELVNNRIPTLFNNGDSRRDYVHVDDVISLLLMINDSSNSFSAEIFNICGGKGYSVKELYEIFLKVSGKSVVPVYRDPKLFWDQYETLFFGDFPFNRNRIVKEVFKEAVGSNAKAKNAFGWSPRVSIDEGIRSVYLDAIRRLAAGGLQ